jgi:pyruvate dehydrogenase E1 component alpha subunit
MPGVTVDGQDVFAVYETAQKFIAAARTGCGPALLEAKTWRFRGHFSGEPAGLYRTQEEEAQWLKKDPLLIAREKMLSQNLLTEKQMDEIHNAVAKQLEAAVEFARNSPAPAPESAVEEVYA